MAIPSHKDYYQVNWEITFQRSLNSQVVQSIVIAVLVFAILGSVSMLLIDLLHLDDIAYYILAWGLCFVGVVGTWTGWLLVTRYFNRTQRHRYKLTANGLEIENHNLPLTTINAESLLQNVNRSDYEPHISNQVYSLNLPLKKGHRLLYFPDKHTHDKVLQAFNRYLSESM